MTSKTCRDCGETKPLTEFYKHSSTKDRKQPYCKLCHNKRSVVSNRKHRARTVYGLTVPQYHAFFWSVNNLCVCGNEATVLDHSHKTGKVRRALCSPCNQTIGLFNEDPELMRTFANYLEEHAV